MIFTLINSVLAHTPEAGAPMHFHLWHVALVVGALLCVLLFAGIAILDLRKALREEHIAREEAERKTVFLRQAAHRLRANLSALGKDFAALSDELSSRDPRFKAAAELIRRRGAQLSFAARIAEEAITQREKLVAKLDEKRRALVEVDRQNVENAASLSESMVRNEETKATLEEGVRKLQEVEASLQSDSATDTDDILLN